MSVASEQPTFMWTKSSQMMQPYLPITLALPAPGLIQIASSSFGSQVAELTCDEPTAEETGDERLSRVRRSRLLVVAAVAVSSRARRDADQILEHRERAWKTRTSL